MRSTLIAGLFGVSLLVPALPAQALYIHDMCGGTPSEGAGMTCPPGDYYLIRPLFSDGTCGDWVCCPKNAGGPSTGYNCEQGVPPTRGAISGTVKKFLGPHVLPNLTAAPGTTKPTAPLTTAPIMRRGVDSEQPDTGMANPSGTSPETK
jgi:hypothetical protein